jgi:hypothetical protein
MLWAVWAHIEKDYFWQPGCIASDLMISLCRRI